MLVIIVIDLADHYQTIYVFYEFHLSARRPMGPLDSFREHFIIIMHSIIFSALSDLLSDPGGKHKEEGEDCEGEDYNGSSKAPCCCDKFACI